VDHTLPVQKFSLHGDWIHVLLVLVLVLSVYVWSMPGSVVFEDDSYFILAAYFNAVTHPPGYPLFTLIGHLFTYLPAGSMAFRVHLASAFLGASACIVLWIFLRMLFVERIYAYIGAIGLGISGTFWSQAIIAEVYTLNVLLFLILVVLALQCNFSAGRKRSSGFKWLFFVYGLSLSNHWPLVLLSTPALIILLWPVKNDLDWRAVKYVPFFLLGLLPYGWLVWCSYHAPQISFYGPIQSWADFWFYVSRQLYADVDQNLTAGWPDKWNFIVFAISQTAGQLAPYGIWFTLIGFWRQWLCWPVWLPVAITTGYLGNTLVLILLLGFDYDLFHRATFQVYPLISYLVIVIWMVLGIHYVIDQVKRLTHFTSLLYIIPLVIIAAAFLNNVTSNYRKNDYLATDYAHAVLESLEENAIFYANADNIDGPIRYLNTIEKVRPDVTVFTGRYIYFKNQLYRPYLMKLDELNELINKLIQDTDQPVYYVNDFPNNYAQDRYGFYTKVNRERPPDRTKVFLQPGFIELLDTWKRKSKFSNLWNYMHFNLILSDFCELAMNARYSSTSNTAVRYFDDVSAVTCTNYQGILKKIRYALNDPDTQPDELDKLFDNAQTLQDQAITREEGAMLAYYHAIFNLGVNNKDAARRDLHASMDYWPHPDNPARKLLSVIPK
jgi:hypothetical protein